MGLFTSSRPGIRGRVIPKFPAQVLGGTGITVTKANGVYTFKWNISTFGEVTSIAVSDVDNMLFPLWNEDADVYNKMSFDNLLTALAALLSAPSQTITAAGTVTVAAADRIILVNKSVQSNTPYTLPTLASRNYAPLTVLDYSGLGGDHIFTPNGSERIHGQSPWTATAPGAGFPFVLRLYPFTGVGWCVE